MNKKIGGIASLMNTLFVLGFALSMFAGMLWASYLTSIFIAWSLVAMLCAFTYYCEDNKRVAGFCAIAFGAMYALCNTIVYFTQITTVRLAVLTEQAVKLLDFQRFGLFFNYDMLGYCLMALATFFVGLTIDPKTKADQWLKWLLLIHGVFAVTCFVAPLLGLFSADMVGGAWVGTALMLFWCAYFTPVGLLSFCHFKNK